MGLEGVDMNNLGQDTVMFQPNQRTHQAEDIRSILEGTLHILQLYTDILNGMSPRTYVVGSEVKLD